MYNALHHAAQGLFTGLWLAQEPLSKAIQGLKPDEALERLQQKLTEPNYVAEKQKWQHLLAAFNAHLAENTRLDVRVQSLDAWVGQCAELTDFSEYLFDLSYIAWLAQQQADGNDDWMDGHEWQRMEDKLAERGTELLNLLMYLQEVADSELKANLEDFIEQYLTDDEMDFQDDLEVYEEVIANQDWLDLPFTELVAKAEKLAPETAIPEVFVALFCFFKSPEKAHINLAASLAAGGNLQKHFPITMALLLFYKGPASIPPALLL
jgi:hypothetical protein